jgi:anti-sigma-K factor RskA
MKTTPNAYSDDEIARYVLGLDMPERVADIQARLARDDAAAARALKWETYFLGIVDALPAQPAPDAVLDRICQSLGMTVEDPPILGDTRAPDTDVRPHAEPAPARRATRRSGRPRLRRGRLALALGAAVVLCLAALSLWAGLKPLPAGTEVQQSVQLTNH